MKKIYRLFIIMMLVLMANTSKAQNDGISLTLLPHFSYNNFYNPAIPVESNFVVGVGVSNIGLSVFNSSIRYDNLYSVVDGVFPASATGGGRVACPGNPSDRD